MSNAAFSIMPTKETASCCQALRDALGRPPIGFCGPRCSRRAARILLAEYLRRVPHVMRHYQDVSLDRYDGERSDHTWEPLVTEWDDPTSDAVLGGVVS